MAEPQKELDENIPECVEVKLAYDLAAIPVFGLILYPFLYTIIALKLGYETVSKSFWLKKARRRLWTHTGRPVLLCFLVILGIIFYLLYQEIYYYPARARYPATQQNLHSLRAAIDTYYAKTGTYPSYSLKELYTIEFDMKGKMKTILHNIPPELISKKDLRPAEQNPPNRRIYNRLGTEGGWFYDPASGKVFVNFNKPLGEEWGKKYAGENPSTW